MGRLITALIAALALWLAVGRSPERADTLFDREAGEPGQGDGEKAASIVLTSAERRSFTAAMGQIAQQGKLVILAEGGPLSGELSANEAARLPDGPLSPSKLAAAVAKAYDYEAQSLGGIVLLKKRFSYPADLPGVTVDECRAALRDSIRVIRALSGPETDSVSRIRHVLSSFSSVQAQALASERGIRLSEMAPEQRSRLDSLLFQTYLNHPGVFARQCLQVLDKSYGTTFVRKPWQEQGELIGFEQPGESFWPVQYVMGRPVEPPVSSRQAPGSWGETVASLLERLNARGSSMKITAEHELDSRPVTVFGAEHTSPPKIAAAMARLLGARLAKDETEYRLLRPAVRMPRRLADLAPALRQTLPEPLLRMLKEPDANFQDRITAVESAVNPMAAEATQRLLEELAPLLDKPPGRVSLAKLSPRARSAFALRGMAEYLVNGLARLSAEPPPYVAAYTQRPETLRLRLAEKMLNVESENGQMLIGLGLPQD
jgi:hypothetical protein